MYKNILYKDLCFIYNDKLVHIDYMNNNFIFIDN